MTGPNLRLTVVENVVHRSNSPRTTNVPSRFSRQLTLDEQVWQRTKVVTYQWELLEAGWIRAASMVVIQNLGHPNPPPGNPTPEQKEDLATRVLWVCFDERCLRPDILIPPGESGRFSPAALERVSLRMARAEARVAVYVFPA
jgi:hypothetical protein